MHNIPAVSRSLRAVAFFEASKGVLTLLAGFGLLTLLHRDVESIAATVIRMLHLHPEGHYPALFLQYAGEVTDAKLWGVFLAGIFYAMVRFTEAFGLWNERPWAEWFGALSGSIYIPFELYELYLGSSFIKIAALLINILVILVIAVNIRRRLKDEAQLDHRGQKNASRPLLRESPGTHSAD
ncbi:MAG: hypothetical protein RLZ25_1252 [Pseudomonadota bacterium]|jgi:uncharacterized membrane protein (DUF2068 family)